MAQMLYFAPARLGEAVMATGALDAALAGSPGARLVAVCTEEALPLHRAIPGLAAQHELPERADLADWLSLWRKLAGGNYDLLLDARGAPISGMLRARRRLARRRPKQLRHRVAQYSDMLGSERPLSPRLWIDAAARAAAEAALPDEGPLLVLGPAAPDPARAWIAERYAAVARRLASGSGPLAGARIAICAPARNAEAARAIARSLDSDGVAATDLAGALDALAAGALFERATLFIGEHSGFMQLAAAAGAATLGLFGPSDERVHGPYGPRARALRGRDYEEVMALSRDGGRALMDDVTVDAVEAEAAEMLRAGGLG